ncbi:hypothetical protein ACWDB3_15645 [Streptomyces bacillaris]
MTARSTGGTTGPRTPLAELPARPAAADTVRRTVPRLPATEPLTVRGGPTLLRTAALTGHPGRGRFAAVADEPARLLPLPDHHRPRHDGESRR